MTPPHSFSLDPPEGTDRTGRAKNKPPAFQFYADDFVAGVLDMTREERGDYIMLLCWQWSKGSIPRDPARLSRIVGGEVSKDVLAKFCFDDSGHGKNSRLEKVRAAQLAHNAEKSEKGKKGAAARWHKHCPGNARADSGQCPEDGSPSPSPSPREEEREAHSPSRPHSFVEEPSSDEVLEYAAGFRGVLADGTPGPIDKDWAWSWWDKVDNSTTYTWSRWKDWRRTMVKDWRKEWREHQRQKSTRRGGPGDPASPSGSPNLYPRQVLAELEQRVKDNPNSPPTAAELEKARTDVFSDEGAPMALRIACGEKLLAEHAGNPENTVGSMDRKKEAEPEFRKLQEEVHKLRALRRAANRDEPEP